MRRSKFKVLGLLIGFAGSSFASAEHAPVPRDMGALGDSMTAGAFADTRRSDGIYPWVQALFFDELLMYEASGERSEVIERRYLSWSTGSDPLGRVVSHAERLRLLNGQSELPRFNAAVTGALSMAMRHKQLPSLFEWSAKELGKTAPDYVTILIGGNDICSSEQSDMTPTADYVDNVGAVVDEVLSRSPDTRVLVLALPKIETLRATTANQPLTGPLGYAKTCADLWKVTQECERVTLEPDPSKLERVGERTRDYFEKLNVRVQDLRARHGDRARISRAPYETPFVPNDLAMDCFHPSPEGQARISEVTWKDSWWAH